MLSTLIIKAKNKQKARAKAIELRLPFSDPRDFGKYRFEIDVEHKEELLDIELQKYDMYIWKTRKNY